MTEIATTFAYSKDANGAFSETFKENVTSLSVGIQSRRILDKDASLQGALSTFTIEADSSSATGVTILLPGIVYHSPTTFRHQIPELASLKQTVVGINYSDSLYSQTLLTSQITDFINNPKNRDKQITLLGVSLGAGTIIDLLGNADAETVKNIRRVIMLGAIYSDQDILNGTIGKAIRLANKMTPDAVVKIFAPLAKRLFRADPMYADPDETGTLSADRQVSNVSNESLANRTRALGETKAAEDLGKFEEVPALFGWWQEDYASPEARQKLQDLFPQRAEFSIDGHHGWTSSYADQINTAISGFFSTNV